MAGAPINLISELMERGLSHSESYPTFGAPSATEEHTYSNRSFNVKRHKKDEQNLHRLLLAVAFNYIN